MSYADFDHLRANGDGLGSLVKSALIEGYAAINAAREAAIALDKGDAKGASNWLAPYREQVNPGGTVYDDVQTALADSMPQEPSETSGY